MSNSTELYKKLMEQAQNDKMKLNSKSLKELRKLYQDSIDGIISKAESSKGGFTKAWSKDYEKYLRGKMNEIDEKIAKLTKDAIISSSQTAATTEGDFLSVINSKYELNIPEKLIGFAYNVSDDVILNIINGGLYKDNRSLSDRIWGYGDKNIKDIQYIINKGMIEQKSYLEIMKDLEMYVNPEAKKTWEWKKVYPGVNKQVDYNAQRLLRTSINHSFFNTNMNKWGSNPFVEAVHWELSDQHYYRQVKHFGLDECDGYNSSNNYGLGSGNFPKNEVPMPHVQCMCYQYAIIPESLDEIGRELRYWMNGKGNSKLDNWFNPMSKVDDNINVSKEGNNDIISNKKWLTSDFSTKKKFDKHIEKHLHEYGDMSQEEYLDKARKILAEPISEDLEGFVSEIGFLFKYRKSTNDFALGKPDDKISTLFKPDKKLDYWKEQKILFDNKEK